MKNSKEYAHGNTASAEISQLTDDQAERQRLEAAHWETLRSLLTQLPAAPFASEPLLKPAPCTESITIARSTAEHFPLPSVVPGSQLAEQHHYIEPFTKQTTQVGLYAHAAAISAIETTGTDEIAAATPIQHTEPRKRSSLHPRLTESWAERMSQRVLSSLGHTRTVRPSGIKPANQAEVVYNPQGKVDYVTYTINAPMRKSRGGSRS